MRGRWNPYVHSASTHTDRRAGVSRLRRRRGTIFATLAAVAAFACLGGSAALAHEEPGEDEGDDASRTFLEALKEGNVDIGLRYRFESVSDDAPQFVDDAEASTLRTAVAYRTAGWRGFRAAVTFENVSDLGAENSHANAGAGDAGNGVTNRPPVVDPPLTELLGAAIHYDGFDGVALSAGRAEVVLGGARYVGNVGWRQHHQSFDLVRVDVDAIPKTKLTYAFLDRQHRIFGDSRPMDSHVLFADVECGGAGTLTVYGLELDYGRLADSGVSTTTYGARFRGKPECDCGWAFPYSVELANQSDTGLNPNDVDADYYRVSAGASRGALALEVARESLGGAPGEGRFTTPLATLHAWNGWADKFLVTPPNGLVDTTLAASYRWGERDAFQVKGVLHRFEADTGGADYGDEIDVELAWTAPWKQRFALRAALYDADTFSTDTEKIWAYTTFGFRVGGR